MCCYRIAHIHLTGSVQKRHARRQGCSRWGTIYLPWLNGDCGFCGQMIALTFQWSGKKAKGKVIPLGIIGMVKAQLFIRGIGDANTKLCQFACLSGLQSETQRLRVHYNKAIAAISCVHCEQADAGDVELDADLTRERW